MVTLEKIQEELATAIKNSNLSQTKLAEMIGVRQQTVSGYATKKVMPALDTLSKLCTALDLDANEILCVERPKEY